MTNAADLIAMVIGVTDGIRMDNYYTLQAGPIIGGFYNTQKAMRPSREHVANAIAQIGKDHAAIKSTLRYWVAATYK